MQIVAVVKSAVCCVCVLQDGGGLNATANLTVSVINSAGYPPVFVKAQYNATVDENAALVRAIIIDTWSHQS